VLSRRFRAQSEFLGDVKRGRFLFDICFRYWVDYTNLVWVAAEEDALHLSIVFPFHPPLCIPWDEIEANRTKFLWRNYLVLSLGSEERIPMRVSESTAKKLGILERIRTITPEHKLSGAVEARADPAPPLQ
jgi:hypothetical protein